MDNWQEICDKSYSDPSAYIKIFEGIEMPISGGFVDSISRGAEEREEYVSKAIKRLKPDVHICGLVHMYEELPIELHKMKILSKKTLANRISKLKPEILKLINVDSLSDE